jgi:predicted Zn-dependent protease
MIPSRFNKMIGPVLLAVALAVPATADDKKKNSDIENIGDRNINKGSINFTSLEKETALGRQLSADIEREAKLVDDPVITEYVNRLGQNLVRNSDARVPFTIKVIDSEEINAFALPGGFLYVNTGLILAADDESELAGVLAHEIAHVTARHGTENQAKSQLISYATIPLIFLGGLGGYAAQQAANFLVPMTFLKFSRKAEEEADYLGVQYLYATGYDPNGMLSLFEKLQAKEKSKPGTISGMFSSHPATADRIKKTKGNIATVLPERDQWTLTTSEFDDVKDQLIAMDNRAPVREERRPTLRRRTRRPDVDRPGDSGEPESGNDDRPVLERREVDSGDPDTGHPEPNREAYPETDDRPVLKRKPGI